MKNEGMNCSISRVEALKKANAEECWKASLRQLPAMHRKLGRNPHLIPVARLGLATGRSGEQVAREIIAAGGQPRLTDYEVRRALEKAQHPYRGGGHAGRVTMPRSDGGRFFRRMIEAGRQMEKDGCLPIFMPIGCTNPGQRQKEYLAHLWAIHEACGHEGLWWTGKTQYDRRDRKSLRSHWSLIHAQYRSFIIPNPMTGRPGLTGDGKESYACKATVAKAALIVCEFDHLPPEDQLLFWSGVIDAHSLDVVSLVWSGSKSYHALVRVPDGRDRAEYALYLQSIMPGIDHAPMQPCGLTRLAGGINEKNGALQRLVWTR